MLNIRARNMELPDEERTAIMKELQEVRGARRPEIYRKYPIHAALCAHANQIRRDKSNLRPSVLRFKDL